MVWGKPEYQFTEEEQAHLEEQAFQVFREYFVSEARQRIIDRKMERIGNDEMFGRKLPSGEEFKKDVEESLKVEMITAGMKLAKILFEEVSIG